MFDFGTQCCCDEVSESMVIISIEIQAGMSQTVFKKENCFYIYIFFVPSKTAIVSMDLFILLMITHKKHTQGFFHS